jgi:hypothetical protein
MRTAMLLTALTVVTATLPGCFFWHTEHEHDRDEYRTSRACGNEVCARGQACVTEGSMFHCE